MIRIVEVKTMVKLLSLLILVALQIGSLDLYTNAHPLLSQKSGQGITNPNSWGCACHCATDTVAFQVWQHKDGAPDRFAAKAIGRWFNRMTPRSETESFSKTELLILMGKSGKGIWSIETQMTDGGAEIYADLVCTTVKGKRKVFPLIIGLYDVNASSLVSLILRRLRQFARSRQWDAGSLISVKLPLLTRPPALIFHEKGKLGDEGYVWSLDVKAKNGRLLRITRRDRADSGEGFFRAAKCFGGVKDDSGETWWILVKTAFADNCSTCWYPIRLTHGAPAKQ
jgi:hypothetical protein